MNKYLIFLFANLLLTSCSALLVESRNPMEKEMYNVLNKVSKESEKKFNMKTIATSIGSPEWVLDHLSIDFQIHGPLTKARIKEICTFVGTQLRDEANANPILAKNMKSYPFNIENVGTTLFIISKDNSDIYYPDYCIGKLFLGRFYFRTEGPNQRRGYKTTEEEEFVE